MTVRKLLVTGASGKLGQLVVSYLLNEHQIAPSDLIVTTRKPQSLAGLAAKGVEVREADFSDPASLDQAFYGAEHLLLISVDTIGRRGELHRNAIKAAERAGVKHISYTSMPATDTSPLVFAYEHIDSEKAIFDSGIPNWTILRNNFYFETLPEFMASVLQTGTWFTAAAQGRSAQISRADLAYAAACSLVQGAETKVTIALNGPESLTIDEMAKHIDIVLKTKTNVVHLLDENYKNQLEEFKLPEDIVTLLTSLDLHTRGNYSQGDCEEFELLTGKKPQTFSSWLGERKTALQALTRS